MPKKLFARRQMLKHHMRTRTDTDTYVQMYNDEKKKLFARPSYMTLPVPMSYAEKIIRPAANTETSYAYSHQYTCLNVQCRKNYLPGVSH
jgi:hypothetical protein